MSLYEQMQYPVKAPSLRRHMMKYDGVCPECGGDLAVGYECNKCDFDGYDEMRNGTALEDGNARQ